MAHPHALQVSIDDSAQDAEAAIAMVLRAEADARESIARSRIEATQIAEAARAQARTLSERTERRIRAVMAAFERERNLRLAEIDAAASAVARPTVLTPDEAAALDLAVDALARELTGGPA